MSSSRARFAGLLAVSVICLALVPARAEVVSIESDQAQPRHASLAADVSARLRQIMPDEAIQVRMANSGLVLSGRVSDLVNLHRVLAVAEEHAPGRVSNLMTVGRLPQIELSLQLAEMPHAVARNLSASMGMAGMFAPAAPGETGALPGLIAALAAKGVLRPVADTTLTVSAGRVTHLPAGSACDSPSGTGIGMDLTPTLADGGTIAVTLRTCLPGTALDREDRVVTILLQDGQTFAVADVLPDLLRDPTAYSSALADEPTLGALLASGDYREGRTEVMILITARVIGPGPTLSAAPSRTATGNGMILTTRTFPPDASQASGTEAFTLSHTLLK